MTTWLSPNGWPLRVKMAALLVVASLLPLVVLTVINIGEGRQRLLSNTSALLAARADHLAGQMDTFHRGYQLSVLKLARLPAVIEFCAAKLGEAGRLRAGLQAILDVHPANDGNLRGVSILDASGTVRIGTRREIVGKNLSYHGFVRDALRGAPVISDIHFGEIEIGDIPTVAYLAPVSGPDGTLVGLVVVWVRAAALWDVAKASNELAGPRSFAVIFDRLGIRIGHTYNDDIVFHPAGRLDPGTIETLAAERRFGDNTRALLDDVRAFPEQFDRALSAAPDQSLFRGFAPVNRKWNLGVARRLTRIPWTVFYMVPEEALEAQLAALTQGKTILATLILLAALAAGAIFATFILRPIRALTRATEQIAEGDLKARVQTNRHDEIGQLGESFNTMAERIQHQTEATHSANRYLADANQELKVSQERFRKVFNDGPLGMTMTALDLTLTHVNAQFCKMLGYSEAELLRLTFKDFTHPDDLNPKTDLVGQLIRGEIPILHMENRYIRKDGAILHGSQTAVAVRDSEGEPQFFLAMVEDITPRKQAERALRVSEERFRRVVESLPNALVIVDHEGQIKQVNNQARSWFGYDPEELIGQPVEILLPEPLHEAHRKQRSAYLTAPTSRTMGRGLDLRAKRKDGSTFPVDVSLSPIQTDQGPEVIASVVDVTESRQAQEALAKLNGQLAAANQELMVSQQRFRKVFDDGPLGMTMSTLDNRLTHVNAQFCRMLGYDEAELLQLSYPEFTHPDDQNTKTELVGRLLRGEIPIIHLENRYVRKDGSILHGSQTAVLVRDSQGQPQFFLAMVEDITPRKEAERALRLSEERFRRVFDDCPLGMTISTLENRHSRVNAKFCAMLGYSEAELLQLSSPEFTHPDDRSTKAELVGRLLRGEIPILHLENRYVRKDGAIVHGGLTAVVVRDGQGQPQFILAMVEDITARKQAQESLSNSNRELASANRELESFAYSVSHDLRQPLRGVTGYCKMLEEDFGQKLEPEAHRFIKTIVAAAEKMGQLIDDLLNLSRISREQMVFEPVDLSSLCRDVVNELHESDPARRVDVQIEEGLAAQGDPRLLLVLLRNLIGNAWKFTSKRADPRISIGWKTHNGTNEFFVADNGVGFDMKYADKLFGAFQRLHKETEFEGTGIGLATVQRVVNRHGGRVRAEAEEGKGARFYFSW